MWKEGDFNTNSQQQLRNELDWKLAAKERDNGSNNWERKESLVPSSHPTAESQCMEIYIGGHWRCIGDRRQLPLYLVHIMTLLDLCHCWRLLISGMH